MRRIVRAMNGQNTHRARRALALRHRHRRPSRGYDVARDSDDYGRRGRRFDEGVLLRSARGVSVCGDSGGESELGTIERDARLRRMAWPSGPSSLPKLGGERRARVGHRGTEPAVPRIVVPRGVPMDCASEPPRMVRASTRSRMLESSKL